MFTVYIAVTVLAAAANLFAAGADFVRYPKIAINMDRAGVPRSWMISLGILKAAGALGLLIGIFVPPIGIAAAVGLVLFFVGAIITHLRGHYYAFTAPIIFLTLAVAALVLRLAVSGVTIAPVSL
jgi:tetrahydromethanopterin S-methyltransferase subunit C